LLPLFLAACAGSAPPPADLSLACQLTKCTCVGERPSFFAKIPTADVLFQKDGTAYCALGMRLERGTPEAVKERRY
jgi:hypothetical protein